MAGLGVLSCVILLCFSVVSANVPVLVWESSKSDRVTQFPALHRTSSDEYQRHMLKKLHGEKSKSLVVLFPFKSLSMEDFSSVDSEGRGYFPQVKYITENAAAQEFLPSVQDPIDVIMHLSDFGYSIQDFDTDKVDKLPDGCGKILVAKMDEAKSDEGRPELLRHHDNRIAEIYSQLLSKCSHVIGVLSGKQSSYVEVEEIIRMRRSIDDAANMTDITFYQDEKKGVALLATKSAPILIYEKKEILLGNTNSSSQAIITGDNSKPSDIKLVAKYPTVRMTFNFDNRTSGYWSLKTVDLEYNSENHSLKPSQDIEAPMGWSYHSAQPVKFTNENVTLTFSDLQVQPFFLNPGSKAFGEAVDVVTFFTPAIWSGIFVTFLLAIIFTWGISMIMDIRTMDQFDDPKGKTITVSATD